MPSLCDCESHRVTVAPFHHQRVASVGTINGDALDAVLLDTSIFPVDVHQYSSLQQCFQSLWRCMPRQVRIRGPVIIWSGRRGSNPHFQAWEADTYHELRPLKSKDKPEDEG